MILVAVALAAGGCVCGFNSSTLDTHRCGTGGLCSAGEECLGGYCVQMAGDGGAGDRPDTTDTGMDPPPDPPADPPADPDVTETPCASPNILCGTTCVDPATDPRNCGGCATACDPVAGSCQSGSCGCVSGFSLCGGGTCIDLGNDPLNCGSCGMQCGSRRQYCSGGTCVCRPGLINCAADGCVNLMDNDNDCGMCGRHCTGAGMEFCSMGACVAACATGETACNPNNNSCVPISSMDTDPVDCGGCAIMCARDEICAGGNCETFVIGRLCTRCPCADCPGGSTCCLEPGMTGVAICLTSGAGCP